MKNEKSSKPTNPRPDPRKGNVKRLIDKFEGNSEITAQSISTMFRRREISTSLANKVNTNAEVESLTPKTFG